MSTSDDAAAAAAPPKESRFSYKNTPSNKRAIMAEFIATALFVYVGCGAAVASQTMLGLDGSDSRSNSFLVVVALAFGLGISVLAYGIAPVSGGHINPAVTFALMVLGQMRIVLGLLYVASQLVGAVLGAALVYGTFAAQELKLISGEETPPFLLGMNSVAPAISYGSAFLGEAMGTFLLVFTVLMTAVYKHNIASNIAPIAIGWSVFLAHAILIPITGCGINPARSFGPMVVNLISVGESISYNGWWVYYTAPFAGAFVAAVICRFTFGIGSDGEGFFGEDSANEEEMKALREAEPLMEANIHTGMDKKAEETA